MHIVAKSTLKNYWEQNPETEGPLTSWFYEAKNAEWTKPSDVKEKYGSADPIADNRVVFNIKGNNYRLVVKIHYNTGIIYIRFIGTHAEYDKIDAEKI